MKMIYTIQIFAQWRDKARIERLNDIGTSTLEILRAGLTTWEDRKKIRKTRFPELEF